MTLATGYALAQTSSDSSQTTQAPEPIPAKPPAGIGSEDKEVKQPAQLPQKSPQEIAAEQLRQQEHQRILGIFPSFNVSNISDALPLSPKQKLQLSFKSATDPMQFAIAGVDAAISQAEDDYHGYGQGAQGYFKRWGASYADNFDGAFFGGAVFPILLHQDPRYFRKGVGSFRSRFFYAIATTFRAKGDDGDWQPNYSNLLGNLAAGGIANLYYPSTDRGVGLIFERAFTVTAEGAAGGLLLEFWPDVSRHFFHKK